MLHHFFQFLFPELYSGRYGSLRVTRNEVLSTTIDVRKDKGIDYLPHSIVSATAYHRSRYLQRAFYTMKYRRNSEMINPVAALLLKAIRDEVKPGMVLCPVPLYWKRYVDRGFNQSVGIAEFLAGHLKLPVEQLLRRKYDTGHQAWRKRDERLQAVQNAFVMKHTETVPRHVVLIDDIVTTGATLHACAKVLHGAGVRRVDAWVVSRG